MDKLKRQLITISELIILILTLTFSFASLSLVHPAYGATLLLKPDRAIAMTKDDCCAQYFWSHSLPQEVMFTWHGQTMIQVIGMCSLQKVSMVEILLRQ
jgi:hypothetical protein